MDSRKMSFGGSSNMDIPSYEDSDAYDSGAEDSEEYTKSSVESMDIVIYPSKCRKSPENSDSDLELNGADKEKQTVHENPAKEKHQRRKISFSLSKKESVKSPESSDLDLDLSGADKKKQTVHRNLAKEKHQRKKNSSINKRESVKSVKCKNPNSDVKHSNQKAIKSNEKVSKSKSSVNEVIARKSEKDLLNKNFTHKKKGNGDLSNEKSKSERKNQENKRKKLNDDKTYNAKSKLPNFERKSIPIVNELETNPPKSVKEKIQKAKKQKSRKNIPSEKELETNPKSVSKEKIQKSKKQISIPNLERKSIPLEKELEVNPCKSVSKEKIQNSKKQKSKNSQNEAKNLKFPKTVEDEIESVERIADFIARDPNTLNNQLEIYECDQRSLLQNPNIGSSRAVNINNVGPELCIKRENFPESHMKNKREVEKSVQNILSAKPNAPQLCIKSENIEIISEPSLTNSGAGKDDTVISEDKLQKCITKETSLFDKLISTLVSLNPKWLKEQVAISRPPAEVKEGAKEIPISFDCYDSYVSSFYPMLLLEIWSDMCVNYPTLFKNVNKSVITFYVTSWSHKPYYMKLICETVNNFIDDIFIPKKGTIIGLDLVIDGIIKRSFGYTADHEMRSVEGSSVSKQCQFIVYTKLRKEIPVNTKMKCYVICSITEAVQNCETLSYLKTSPLLNDILCPTVETFSISSTHFFSNVTVSSPGDAITLEFKNLSDRPQIILVRGPPGTGKTKTIIDILFNLESTRSNVKVLVIAPTAVALDVIHNGLIGMNETCFDDIVDFVNFRKSKTEHSNSHSIHDKARLMFDRNSMVYLSGNADGQWEKNASFYYKAILKQYNIVLATLSDLTDLLKYKDDIKFSWCIIDAVNQCTELQSILPLTLGIKKILLVGDTKLFKPNVRSKLAKQLGYERSILERFHTYLTQKGQNLTVTLSKQFRMPVDICEFPSHYFYKEEWSVVSNHLFFLLPYMVFDKIINSESSTILSDYEDITEMCKIIRGFCSMMPISVIVPNYEEIRYCKTALANSKISGVEVDVLEAYQGRETGIVILSCFVKNKLFGSYFQSYHQLNVALTRAFNTLILCGHLSCIQFPMWGQLVADAKKRNLYISYRSKEELSSNFLNSMVRRDLEINFDQL